MTETRLVEIAFVRGPMLRLESRVAIGILMLSENWITESAILTEVRPCRHVPRCTVV